MAISGYDKHSFGKKLNEVVSPSRPILSLEYLIGRDHELDRIEKALLAPGRNVFIFGERGVGKSSLAATAANIWQSSDSEYIDISCAPDSTINSIVSNIASQAINKRWTSSNTVTTNAKVGFKWLSYSLQNKQSRIDLANEIKYLSDCIEVLKEVASLHSRSPVVVIDEVDRIINDNEINKLGDLIKQIGDKGVDIKIIFTGVGQTLDEILGAHESAIRQLETIELPRLSWDARWNIAIEALKQFDITIKDEIYIRLAAVSDGYPYYVHLIVEKLLWILFSKQELVTEVTWEDYYNALDDAILSISAELSRPYMMAINQKTQDYEEVLWSTSADEWQGAYMSDMYSQYESIMRQIENKQPLSYGQFSTRIRNLLKISYGGILIKGKKKGFYRYREKMLRGYVRMQAEANRIEIISKEPKATTKNYMHVPAKNVGYRKSQLPRGFRRV